jgi:ABC-type Fe3+/spermidine/putrescine transport system ATPase subunit
MRKIARDEIAVRVKEALELVRLEGFETRYPKQLSGGQQQRISLARSIVSNPSLLLMDEPLGALDKKLREHMQIELKQLHRKLGMTVIYVTHDQEEALTMSDRIAVMNDGQISQIGIPDVIYQRPDNLFVADFIGESNFIGAAVVETNADCAVVARGESRICVPAVNGLEKGQSVTVLLRPERINILTEADKEQKNVFPAIIQDDLYIGNLNRYLVEVPSWGIVVNVELRNAQDTIRFQAGQNVFISWRVLDTILVQE